MATDWVWYRSTDGVQLNAYLAWPAGTSMNSSLPGVTVCHQNRGLQLHIRDVARRYAKQGYVAIAPDLPSRTGTRTDDFPDVESLMASYRQLTPEQNALDFAASLALRRAIARSDSEASRIAESYRLVGGALTGRLEQRGKIVYLWDAAASPTARQTMYDCFYD